MDIAVHLFINLLTFHNITNNDIHLVLLYVSPGHVDNCPLDMLFYLTALIKITPIILFVFPYSVNFLFFYLLITYPTKLVNRLQMSPGHAFLEREKHYLQYFSFIFWFHWLYIYWVIFKRKQLYSYINITIQLYIR